MIKLPKLTILPGKLIKSPYPVVDVQEGVRTSCTEILIYQMGRVGSRTVLHSLHNHPLGRTTSLYHFHRLANLEKLEQSPLNARARAHVQRSQRFRKRLLEDPSRHWKVLSLVRDPVAQNISSFFHTLSDHIPDIDGRNSQIKSADLLEVFLVSHDHSFALDWFDSQFHPIFDLDVYRVPFPFENGFSIYDTSRLRLLLMRSEDLDSHFATATSRWIGFKGIEVKRVNGGKDLSYGSLYAKFLKEVTLPGTYLDQMYSSRLATHFYSPDLARLREFWSTPK